MNAGAVRPVALGFIGGFIAGAVLWSFEQRRRRRGLFGNSALGRFAALGYLRGRPSVEHARLLRDYIRWEPHPALRRRGEAVLRRMERILE